MSDSKRLSTIVSTLRIPKKDFAIALGVSQSQFSKMLSGQNSITAESIARIVKQYDVDPNWLLGLTGDDDTVLFRKSSVSDQEAERLRREAEDATRKLFQKVEENAGLYKTISELQAEKINQLKNN